MRTGRRITFEIFPGPREAQSQLSLLWNATKPYEANGVAIVTEVQTMTREPESLESNALVGKGRSCYYVPQNV